MWLMTRSRKQGLVNTVMNLQAPYKAENSLTSSVTVSFSRTLLQGVIFLILNTEQAVLLQFVLTNSR
jgi:hypothetical protein